MNISSSLAILGIVLMAGGGYLFIQPSSPQLNYSGTCLQSAVNPYVFASICPSQTTYLDNCLYATSSTTSTGTWASSQLSYPTQILSTGGFLKCYYFLAVGTGLQSYAITYSGAGINGVFPGVTTGTDSATGLTWIGGPMPTSALPAGVAVDFNVKVTDTAGTTAAKDFFFSYVTQVQQFNENFIVQDYTNYQTQGTAPGLVGVQIIITAQGSTVGQVITGPGGAASIALPNNNGVGYYAAVTSPPSYYPANGQPFQVPAQPNTLYFTLYHGPACSVQGQSNCYPACQVGPIVVGSAQTCSSSATTSTNYAISTCTSGGNNPGPCITVPTQSCVYGGQYPNCNSYTTSFSISSCLTAPNSPGCGGGPQTCTYTTTYVSTTTNLLILTGTTTVTSFYQAPCIIGTGNPTQTLGAGLFIAGVFAELGAIWVSKGAKGRR